MDRAADLPLTAFGLPIRNVTSGVRDTDFFVPGSVLRVPVDSANPLGYGIPGQAAAFFVNGPAFAVSSLGAAHIVASYPARDLLMSGWMLGERVHAGRAAVVEAPLDKGRALFNAILFGSMPSSSAPPNGGRSRKKLSFPKHA